MRIQIPEQFKSWFGKEVVAARGMRRRIYIYTPEKFEEINDKIDKNMNKHGLKYPRFKEFLAAGSVDILIDSNGEIDLPDFLISFMEDKGTLDVRVGQFGLEIGMKRPNEYICNDSTCGKCLSSGCKDDYCTIHTIEKKEEYRNKLNT